MTKWKALSELKRKFEKELKDSGHSYGVTLAKTSTDGRILRIPKSKRIRSKNHPAMMLSG